MSQMSNGFEMLVSNAMKAIKSIEEIKSASNVNQFLPEDLNEELTEVNDSKLIKSILKKPW